MEVMKTADLEGSKPSATTSNGTLTQSCGMVTLLLTRLCLRRNAEVPARTVSVAVACRMPPRDSLSAASVPAREPARTACCAVNVNSESYRAVVSCEAKHAGRWKAQTALCARARPYDAKPLVGGRQNGPGVAICFTKAVSVVPRVYLYWEDGDGRVVRPQINAAQHPK